MQIQFNVRVYYLFAALSTIKIVTYRHVTYPMKTAQSLFGQLDDSSYVSPQFGQLDDSSHVSPHFGQLDDCTCCLNILAMLVAVDPP